MSQAPRHRPPERSGRGGAVQRTDPRARRPARGAADRGGPEGDRPRRARHRALGGRRWATRGRRRHHGARPGRDATRPGGRSADRGRGHACAVLAGGHGHIGRAGPADGRQRQHRDRRRADRRRRRGAGAPDRHRAGRGGDGPRRSGRAGRGALQRGRARPRGCGRHGVPPGRHGQCVRRRLAGLAGPWPKAHRPRRRDVHADGQLPRRHVEARRGGGSVVRSVRGRGPRDHPGRPGDRGLGRGAGRGPGWGHEYAQGRAPGVGRRAALGVHGGRRGLDLRGHEPALGAAVHRRGMEEPGGRRRRLPVRQRLRAARRGLRRRRSGGGRRL